MKGRTDKVTISGLVDNLEEAKITAMALIDENSVDVQDVFFLKSLEMVEINIKKLNEYSDRCWLLSSILLYSLVYDKEMYNQSGLTWEDYKKESKKRLNMSPDEMSRQLSSARFFIKHHNALMRSGWTPSGSARKLSTAELAVEISGSIDDTIKHLATDTWKEFKEWYTSFKVLPPMEEIEDVRPDIEITKNNIKIGGIDAITISDQLPTQEKEQLEKYLTQIFSAIKRGEVPAIVSVYDEREAKRLVTLRDKDRQKR